jgi:phage terminase small subunit
MDIDLNAVPRLTPKQQAFVQRLLEGKSASDAYRAAYDSSKMADRTIWAEASRLRANPKVAAWLRHYQRIGMDEARITIKEHLAELARGREVAYALGQASAAVQAEHSAKLCP